MDSSSRARTERVLSYHARTKHHTWRYARSPGHLDWATQPDPFRTYDGAPRVELPLAADACATRYFELFEPAAERAASARAIDLDSIATFFELALGLTAWKEFGANRWALRADPSSGNLHPTEGYAVLPTSALGPAGVYHYVSRDHVLERRCTFDEAGAREAASLLGDGFLFGVTSIHWREAWKYGERAFRYCQHDAGHVIGTARFAAAALGWTARLAADVAGDELEGLLGIERDEDYASIDERDREEPDAALLVGTPGGDDAPAARDVVRELLRIATAASSVWAGRANPLSPAHVAWPAIDDVAEATWNTGGDPTASRGAAGTGAPPPYRSACTVDAATIVRQRRSAVSLDGRTSISRRTFYSILDATLPRANSAPWDVLPWSPRIHLALFVHRVDELAPGVYLLERDASAHEDLRAALDPRAEWTGAPGRPEHVRLFRLFDGDCRSLAASISCGQDIAGDGAFSLGMLAAFRATLDASPHAYRHLFWEAGVLGQVLYLEAEAHGVRGTGIGCYFDDSMHELLGLDGDAFQSMYHFTLGGAVDDTRLTTLPAYSHLNRAK